METVTFHSKYPRDRTFFALKSTFEKETALLSMQLNRLKKELKTFERKYSMTSSEFYNKFEKGDVGDKQDFFIWVSDIDIYTKLMEEYRLLKNLAAQCKV